MDYSKQRPEEIDWTGVDPEAITETFEEDSFENAPADGENL